MTQSTITIRPDAIPAGYEPDSFGAVTGDDIWLGPDGVVVTGSNNAPFGPRLIIRPIPKKARPYNADEMRQLVGQVLLFNGDLRLVTEYCNDAQTVRVGNTWKDANVLQAMFTHSDGTCCEVVE